MEKEYYELEIVGGPLNVRPVKLHVSQDVIDFLNLHDKKFDDGKEYFIINRIHYRLNGKLTRKRDGKN